MERADGERRVGAGSPPNSANIAHGLLVMRIDSMDPYGSRVP